jgi:cytosine/creatinine deaminase
MLDLIVHNARIQDGQIVDIAVAGGRIAAVSCGIDADCGGIDAGGCLAVPGFVETHLHLDKDLHP